MAKQKRKLIEKLLFEVYDKGLQMQDCNLTDYYEKILQALNIPVVNGSFMPKESKCKYTNTLNDIHSKIVTYKDYWLFTEVFCLLHDNNDFCNCR